MHNISKMSKLVVKALLSHRVLILKTYCLLVSTCLLNPRKEMVIIRCILYF